MENKRSNPTIQRMNFAMIWGNLEEKTGIWGHVCGQKAKQSNNPATYQTDSPTAPQPNNPTAQQPTKGRRVHEAYTIK